VRDQASRFHAWALQALSHYGLAEPEVAYLRHNENITFRVGERTHRTAYLLRIHMPVSPHYGGMRQRPDVIASELLWLDALRRDTSLTVQRPVRNTRGELVTRLDIDGEAAPCTLLTWIEGDEFHRAEPAATRLAERLGVVVAHLHDHAAHWRQPEGFVRPVYDAAYFRRQASLLAPGVEAGVIAKDEYAAIGETVEIILALLASALPSPDHRSLVHNDLQGSNILAWRDDIRPIDFSLCGFGYYLSDLGTTLPSLTRELRPSFLAGYRAHRRVDDADLRLVDGLFLLSRLGAYVFMLPERTNHQWLRGRIPRFATAECQAFLRGCPLLLD
jgi:Ser/Thr protein kinase RdoA (MazF antagonist)